MTVAAFPPTFPEALTYILAHPDVALLPFIPEGVAIIPPISDGLSALITTQDPVDKIMFSFYNDHLFRLVVDYDRDRTIGMTDADMTAAISTVYGLPRTAPAGERMRRQSEWLGAHRKDCVI